MSLSWRSIWPRTLAVQLIVVIALAVLLSNVGVAIYFQMGNERTTFVIGPDGTIERVLRKVKPGEHDQLVLEALDSAA